MDKQQFALSGSSSGFSVIDAVVSDLWREIQSHLKVALEEDPTFLIHTATYLHVLACVGEGTNGYGRVLDLDPDDLERKLLGVYDSHLASDTPQSSGDREFIVTVMGRLRKIQEDHPTLLSIEDEGETYEFQ